MGRNAMDDENRLLPNEEEEDDDDDQEETLSLSDLPIHVEEVELPAMNIQLPDDDFDFGSATTEPEMCAADDVFFRGRILPLRHSVSSDSGLALLRADDSRPVTLYRSGSMDNNYQSHKTTIIRSSSIRSQYSSSCSSSRSSSTRTNNSVSIPKLPKPNPKPSNPFQHYSHRRPVPGSLNRASSSSSRYINNVIGQGQTMKSNNNNNNNNMWSIFRLGLVRTPTMEPLDTKFHGSSNNNRPNMFINQKKEKEKKKKNEEQKFRYFGGGCKCSVETVVVPCRITASEKGTKEKTKRDMSRRHRMYEWLKELSVADDDEEEQQEEEAENGRGNLGKVDSKLAAKNKIIG